MYCIYCGKQIPDGGVCDCPKALEKAAEQEIEQAKAVLEEPVFEVPVIEEPVAEAPVVETPAQPVQSVPAQPTPYVQQSPYVQPVRQANPYAQQPNPYQPAAYQPPVRQEFRITPVHTAVKESASSVPFLLGAIFTSLAFVFTIFQMFLPVNPFGAFMRFAQMSPEVWRAVELSGILDLFYEIPTAPGFLTVLWALPGLILSALVMAGLWITFVSGRDNKSPLLKSSGMTMIKVVQIIGMVGLYAQVLLMIILWIFLMAFCSELDYYMDRTGALMLIVTAICLGVLAGIIIKIVYTFKVLGSMRSVKLAVDTGVLRKKASMFVAIFNFIMASFSILDLYGTYVLKGWVALLLTACTAGAQIAFGLCIMQYNKRMTAAAEQAEMR